MKKVLCITGPTASGKTSLSLKIAKLFDLEIISCDSVQVFKELDIGSAKIKQSEMDGIKHHLIDVLEPKEEVNCAWFQKEARKIIDNNNKNCLLVGGTGLYLNSILYDYKFLSPKRSLDTSLKYDKLDNFELYNLLKEKALFDISKIHENNRRRVLRALEAIDSNTLLDDDLDKPIYNFINFYLDIPRDILKNNITKRLDQMFNSGLVLECTNLYKKNCLKNAIGYKEFIPYFNKSCTLEDVKANIVNNSLKLAKKQKTWFKNKLPSLFIDPLDLNYVTNVAREIHKFLYNNRIILTGLFKSGKTTIGKKLAKILNLEFIDLDQYIENKYGNISDLFLKGEDYFRKLETKSLQELKKLDNVVISLGAGSLLKEENSKYLNGFVIYLDVSIEGINKRDDNVLRPLLNSNNILELANKRIPTYLKHSNLRVKNYNIDDTINFILKYLTYEDIDENISYKWS